MEQLLWMVAGIAMLLLLPTFLVASAAVDLKQRWLRYAFSISFWPLCMFVGLYYFTIVMPSPEADGPASIWLVLKVSGMALVAALFWTWCFRNVLPNSFVLAQGEQKRRLFGVFRRVQIYLPLGLIVVLIGLAIWSPTAYGVLFVVSLTILLVTIPALVVIWLLRRLCPWRHWRIIGATFLGSVIYAGMAIAMFPQPAGTLVLDTEVPPLWVSAMAGGLVSFVLAMGVEIVRRFPSAKLSPAQ